jgi:tRNA threonylcarbamoyladenosine biosynthesis protein TsaE
VRGTVDCPDPAATQALAGRLAKLLRPGDLILIEGDLGAGKTTLTQGLALALGVTVPVTSPTFVLMNIYRTAAGFDLAHVDVYRLDRLSEVVDLALPELLDDGAVVVVEWGERAAAALPGDHLRIRLDVDEDGARRTATLEGFGDSWRERVPA